jgi:hypothetical protein
MTARSTEARRANDCTDECHAEVRTSGTTGLRSLGLASEDTLNPVNRERLR